MVKSKAKASSCGSVPFVLEACDLETAKLLGLLRDDTPINTTDCRLPDYGVAYDKKRNIGVDSYASQQAIQKRCKQFAVKCGFQLLVAGSSSANAKYVCKRLHGQQFFDSDLLPEDAVCPFFINVSGGSGVWYATKTNFAHNHLKNVGFSTKPFAEGSIPRPVKALRNTTQQSKEAQALVESKMLPAHNGSLSTVSGSEISTFLLSEGIKLGTSAISRLKLAIEDRLKGDFEQSFQKLESYLNAMTSENPGSLMKFEKYEDGTFFRACFIPSIGIQISEYSRRMCGFDGAHLKGEMNGYGVYLVATSKDYQKRVTPWAIALVPVENYDNWQWFLSLVRESRPNLTFFTAVSDRDKGLLSAVSEVFPSAGHRFCLEHIKRNICRARIPLSSTERGLISDMAGSDCENDFNLYRLELASTNPRAAEYLDGIDKLHWVKYAYLNQYHIPTYSETTSNLSEQANNWIGNECRSAKPLDAFCLFFMKLAERASSMRQDAADWALTYGENELVPFLRQRREKLTSCFNYCKITPCLEGSYMVRYLGPSKREGYIHPWRHVDLSAKHCTCGDWEDFEFPCVHAVCAAIGEGTHITSLYDADRLSIRHFKATYTKRFVPLPADGQLRIDSSLKIPVLHMRESEQGKRGLKPGPRPQHKRKKTKGSS